MIMRRNKYICHFKVYRTVIRQRKYIFWDQPKLAERRIKKKKNLRVSKTNCSLQQQMKQKW